MAMAMAQVNVSAVGRVNVVARGDNKGGKSKPSSAVDRRRVVVGVPAFIGAFFTYLNHRDERPLSPIHSTCNSNLPLLTSNRKA